jgi:predicted amidohydrolase YtcJ
MKIYHNANLYSPDHPNATAFVVDHAIFIALGTDDEILDSFSHQGQTLNLQGRTIWPGLTDAHVHLRLLAESRAMIDCETASRHECLSRVKNAANLLPEGAWVRGHGWNQNQWMENFGTAPMLDTVCGGRPAYLTAKSLHAAWTNSQALKLAGISQHTPDPPGGEIQRDIHGQPTGILFEAGAMELVESVIPPTTLEETVTKIQLVMPELWKVGLVGVHDFDDFKCWLALQSIYQNGSFPLRVRKHIPYQNLDAFIQAGLHTGFGDDWLDLGGVKLFSDGALGPQTAAMIKPFEGSHTTGTLLLTAEDLYEVGVHAGEHGIALAVHAIGDRAIHEVLNAFERLRSYEKSHHLRHFNHRIEHVQIIDPADLPRLAQLDIIASVQPIHAPSDMIMADHYLGSRSKHAYAYRSILDSGAPYAFGSDAPVEPVNPFFGIHAAVTRRRLDGTPGPQGWHPEQRLTLAETLNGYTHAPAAITGKASRSGKISPGFHADFILLEDDPFKLNPHELGKITPAATFIAGECKYQSAALTENLIWS